MMEGSKEAANGISCCSVPGRRHLLPLSRWRKRSNMFLALLFLSLQIKAELTLLGHVCDNNNKSLTQVFILIFRWKINTQSFPDESSTPVQVYIKICENLKGCLSNVTGKGLFVPLLASAGLTWLILHGGRFCPENLTKVYAVTGRTGAAVTLARPVTCHCK